MESEIWKTISDYPNFEVSDSGRVRRIGAEKCLAPIANSNGYLLVHLYKVGGPKIIRIHRLVALAFVANPDNKMFVDHINRVKTDNRVSNLRWATASENRVNSSTKSKSGYRGVSKHRNRFRSEIRINNKLIHLGLYDTPEEAAIIYDAAAIDAFGEFATLNFPE